MIREYRFFCKNYASERNESLLSDCRVQLFFYKVTKKSDRMFHLITKFNIYNSDVTRAAAWWHQS